MLSDTFTLQQDSASAPASEAVELLSHAMPDFISPDLWLSNNSDINPADYKTCGTIQQSKAVSVDRWTDEQKRYAVVNGQNI